MEYKRLLEGFDWYIVTILNQDGYQATREGYLYVYFVALKLINFLFTACRGHRKNMNPKNKDLCNKMMNITDGSGLENNHTIYTNPLKIKPYRFGWGMGTDLNR